MSEEDIDPRNEETSPQLTSFERTLQELRSLNARNADLERLTRDAIVTIRGLEERDQQRARIIDELHERIDTLEEERDLLRGQVSVAETMMQSILAQAQRFNLKLMDPPNKVRRKKIAPIVTSTPEPSASTPIEDAIRQAINGGADQKELST